MANDDKQPGTNLASNSVVLAALVAAGTTYFVNHEAPLQGSRPAMVEPQIHEMAGTQDIDARLWQDPFAAVAKSLAKLNRSEAEQQCREIPLLDRHCKSPLTGLNEKTLVIGVGVSGAPYPEDAESRRRTRYAVLAGLHKARLSRRTRSTLTIFDYRPSTRPSRHLQTKSRPPWTGHSWWSRMNGS
jgi:hypothetical protein